MTKTKVLHRRLLNLLTALSLLLCVAVLVLWVRSYNNDARLSVLLDASNDRWFDSDHGSLIYSDRSQPAGMGNVVIDRSFFGFGTRTAYFTAGGSIFDLFMPHWFMVLLTAGMPAHRFIRRWSTPSNKVGHCASCGYDLRATPDRCPECGANDSSAIPN